jgi:transcriptional regulator with XRE-family HTH domain
MVTLEELREVAGLTQQQLAEKLAVAPDAVASWERGTSRPSVRETAQLAEAFGVAVDAVTVALPPQGPAEGTR